MQLLEVGKPYPGKIESSYDGVNLEMSKDGELFVFIHMPQITKQEVKLFKKSFKEYAYLEFGKEIPIPCFVFNFYFPIDMYFNANLMDREVIDKFINSDNNMITFILLDRKIIKGIKIFGLSLEVLNLFKETIRKQIEIKFSNSDFNKVLNQLIKHSTLELFKMGVKFSC